MCGFEGGAGVGGGEGRDVGVVRGEASHLQPVNLSDQSAVVVPRRCVFFHLRPIVFEYIAVASQLREREK